METFLTIIILSLGLTGPLAGAMSFVTERWRWWERCGGRYPAILNAPEAGNSRLRRTPPRDGDKPSPMLFRFNRDAEVRRSCMMFLDMGPRRTSRSGGAFRIRQVHHRH